MSDLAITHSLTPSITDTSGLLKERALRPALSLKRRKAGAYLAKA